MAVVVSVIVLAALVALLATVIHVARRLVRWLQGTPITPSTRLRPLSPPSAESSRTPPAYGHLPTPADPVGALGSLSPDADPSSPCMSEGDLIGE
jgi:hypothetical protein